MKHVIISLLLSGDLTAASTIEAGASSARAVCTGLAALAQAAVP
jgi:hypothetical protein